MTERHRSTHNSFLENHPGFATLTLPAFLLLLDLQIKLFQSRLLLRPGTRVENVQTLATGRGSEGPAHATYDQVESEIFIPDGATAEAIIEDVSVRIDDYRRKKGHRGGARVKIGNKTTIDVDTNNEATFMIGNTEGTLVHELYWTRIGEDREYFKE